VLDVDCRLNLDGTELALDERGNWHIASSSLGNIEGEITRLQAHVRKLEEDKRRLAQERDDCHAANQMLSFRNELLVELVRVWCLRWRAVWQTDWHADQFGPIWTQLAAGGITA